MENLEKSCNIKWIFPGLEKKFEKKKSLFFLKSNANLLYSNVNLHGIFTVCFGILIVSLNTKSSHFGNYFKNGFLSIGCCSPTRVS